MYFIIKNLIYCVFILTLRNAYLAMPGHINPTNIANSVKNVPHPNTQYFLDCGLHRIHMMIVNVSSCFSLLELLLLFCLKKMQNESQIRMNLLKWWLLCMQIKSSNCNSSWYDLRILDGLWVAMKKRFNYYHLLYDFGFENAHCAVVECLLLCVLMTRHKQRPEQSRNKTTYIFIILLLRKTDKLTDAVNCANCIVYQRS